MKLLFDQDLSPRLAVALAPVFPGSLQVRDLGLQAASDTVVWTEAASRGLTIVSKDADFRQRSFLLGAPPKVIWLKVGNCTTGKIAALLLAHVDLVLSFERDPFGALLVLQS